MDDEGQHSQEDEDHEREEEDSFTHLLKYLLISFGETSIHHMVRSHAKQFMVEIENLRLSHGIVGEAVAKPGGGSL